MVMGKRIECFYKAKNFEVAENLRLSVTKRL